MSLSCSFTFFEYKKEARWAHQRASCGVAETSGPKLLKGPSEAAARTEGIGVGDYAAVRFDPT
jgi:hypothetical protein